MIHAQSVMLGMGTPAGTLLPIWHLCCPNRTVLLNTRIEIKSWLNRENHSKILTKVCISSLKDVLLLVLLKLNFQKIFLQFFTPLTKLFPETVPTCSAGTAVPNIMPLYAGLCVIF